MDIAIAPGLLHIGHWSKFLEKFQQP